jgi:hypothetical protein
MEKKPDKHKDGSTPFFTSVINPSQLATSMEPAQMHAARIFETKSSVVKEHFDNDMERLRQSLAPGRLEGKPIMAKSVTPAELHLGMKRNIDPRSGHVITANVVPNGVMPKVQIDANHPMHPENQLTAAMKKLGHRL